LLQTEQSDPQVVLDSIVGELGTLALLRVHGQWYTSGVAADPDDLPRSLTDALDGGSAAHQRVVRADRPRLVIGVPLAELDTQYLEIVPLEGLERTYRTLLLSLLVGSVGTTIIGALVGVYVSRRVLRPLQQMSTVAAGITAGDSQARLDARGDGDVGPLVESFNTMVDALQARIEREQRFASDVSHELRTPLTVLRTAVQLVEQRSADMPPRTQEAVAVLNRQVDQFERLVLDLLEMSRLDSGVEHPDPEATDLRAFFAALSAQFEVPHAQFRDDAPEWAHVDRRHLERMLANLIENAQRYAGGVSALWVDRVAEADGDHLVIAVEDEGPGIPPEERERLFERFWRGPNARNQSSMGSGLGLALVAQHASLLGGSVRVESREPRGTRFVVDLPQSVLL
jgi:signal transduction histidine kinase